MWATILLTAFIVLSSTIHHERQEATSDESRLPSSVSNSVNLLKHEFMPQLRADYMKSDLFFQRFLKSNDFDVPRTRQNLLKFIDWRQANFFGKQRRDLSEESEMSIQILKDKQGNTVVYHDMSKTNLRKLVEENGIEEFPVLVMKAIDKACETSVGSQQGERDVSHIGYIIDWTGFNKEQHLCPRCIPAYLEIVKKYEAYYPLAVDRVVFFNTPQAYKDVIALTRPYMSQELWKAYVVFGRDQKNLAKPYFEDWIGLAKLPSSLHF